MVLRVGVDEVLQAFDTCTPDNPQDNCIVEEDGANIDPLSGWPALVRVVRVCSQHQGLDGQALYSTLIEEQKRRSFSLSRAKDIIASSVLIPKPKNIGELLTRAEEAGLGLIEALDAYQSSASLAEAWATLVTRRVPFSWAPGKPRRLQLNLPPVLKEGLEATWDQQWGAGKVEVV